jgi:hypothetical protein
MVLTELMEQRDRKVQLVLRGQLALVVEVRNRALKLVFLHLEHGPVRQG